MFGAGPIGIGALLALRARGVESIVSDPSPQRRPRARSSASSTCSTRAETDVAAASGS